MDENSPNLEPTLPVSAPRCTVFAATVTVCNGVGGSSVTVTLRQMRGLPPFYQQSRIVALDAEGWGQAVFDDVSCAGPATARFIPDGEDEWGTYFYAGDGTVRIT